MSVKQISVFLENKPGELNSLTRVLADHRIDMRAMSLSETASSWTVLWTPPRY